MNIRKLSYIELDEFLNQDIKLTEQQLIDVKRNPYCEDYHYWGRGEYTIEIIKDNGNLYSSVDVFVKE